MTDQQLRVAIFMRKAGQEVKALPSIPDAATRKLRYDLIREELSELSFAFNTSKGDLVGIADALGDLLYVVLGTAVACGIDLEPVFNDIDRSNETKFIDGYRRADGKWMKGPSYKAPNLEVVLASQSPIVINAEPA